MAKRQGSYWKNPAIVGPVVGAAIAAVVGLVLWLLGYIFPDRDDTPPRKPTIVDVKRDSADDGSDVLIFKYEHAEDNEGGSGLKAVRLWYRFLQSGEWVRTDLAKTGESGEIHFAAFRGTGHYSFDVVSTDQRGNQSATPVGTDGQKDYHYVKKVDAPVLSDTDLTGPELALRDFRLRKPDFAKQLDWIVIPVYFHVIHDGKKGTLNDDAIHRQVAVLNRAFFAGKITFTLVSIDRTDNAKWFRLGLGSSTETEVKQSLMRDPTKGLNVYTAELSMGLLGWSTLPQDLAAAPTPDGCVILYSTVPGGTSAPFSHGHTLVHNAGHWVGLYHTFQGGCNGEGDYVDDTVAHAGPNWGKPEVGLRHNACKPGEEAPVQNFMNYVDDDWTDHFTPGQFTRMKEMIGKFRADLLD